MVTSSALAMFLLVGVIITAVSVISYGDGVGAQGPTQTPSPSPAQTTRVSSLSLSTDTNKTTSSPPPLTTTPSSLQVPTNTTTSSPPPLISTPLTTPVPTIITSTSSPPPPLPVPTNTPSTPEICKDLVFAFNTVSKELPISTPFSNGSTAGVDYPPGMIVLKPEARKVDKCVSYVIPGSNTDVIAHIEIVENLDIEFPKYKLNEKEQPLKLEILDNHLVLHYHISRRTSKSKRLLDMRSVLAEVKTLGKVTLVSEERTLNGLDYSVAAEDIVRPKLLEAVNRFAKEKLSFLGVPVANETTQDAFDVLKIIFKRKMIQLDNSLI